MIASPNASKSLSPAMQNLMTLLLSVAGGGVDAAMILRFDVLTAAQTGNTILFAVALAERRLTTGFYAAISVIAYVVGAAASELVLIHRPKHSRYSSIARGLLTELIPLTALLACWHIATNRPHPGRIAVLVALSAVAMGIQSGVVLKIHAGPTTTYVTGTLTTFATCAVQRLRQKAAPKPVSPLHLPHPRLLSRDGPTIYGLDWLVYLSGAAATALLFLAGHEWGLALPVTAVVAASVIAIWLPGVREENHEE